VTVEVCPCGGTLDRHGNCPNARRAAEHLAARRDHYAAQLRQALAERYQVTA
jgi:hypothetical protein